MRRAAEFRNVLTRRPRDVDAMVNLSLAEKATGRTERAKESLLRALGADPRHAPAHYNLAVLFELTGEPARAATHYEAFLAYAGAEYNDRRAAVRSRVDALASRRDGSGPRDR